MLATTCSNSSMFQQSFTSKLMTCLFDVIFLQFQMSSNKIKFGLEILKKKVKITVVLGHIRLRIFLSEQHFAISEPLRSFSTRLAHQNRTFHLHESSHRL